MKDKRLADQEQVFVAHLQLFSFFLERFFNKQLSTKRIIKELESLHQRGQQLNEEYNRRKPPKSRSKKT